MSDLAKLITLYGSDKNLSHYTPCYEAAFSEIRPYVRTLLEVGVGTLQPEIPSSAVGFLDNSPYYTPGGSLRAWRDYFPNAHILGVDVAEDCRFTEERIETMIFSSTDAYQCAAHLQNRSFDIIIDDGLHMAYAQLVTLRNLFHAVNDGGFYVVEDMGGGLDGHEMFSYYQEEVQEIIAPHEYFYRGNMLIVCKNYTGLGEIERNGHGLPSRSFSPILNLQ